MLLCLLKSADLNTASTLPGLVMEENYFVCCFRGCCVPTLETLSSSGTFVFAHIKTKQQPLNYLIIFSFKLYLLTAGANLTITKVPGLSDLCDLDKVALHVF